MDQEKSSIGSTLVSSLAFLVIAGLLAVVAGWLAWLMYNVRDDIVAAAPHLPRRATRATAGMVVGLVAAVIGALFFAAVGLYTLWLGLTDFRKKAPAKDEYWKNMPSPKG